MSQEASARNILVSNRSTKPMWHRMQSGRRQRRCRGRRQTEGAETDGGGGGRDGVGGGREDAVGKGNDGVGGDK